MARWRNSIRRSALGIVALVVSGCASSASPGMVVAPESSAVPLVSGYHVYLSLIHISEPTRPY